MKTSVIMLRPVQGIEVRQNTKTKFFNANDLLELHNKNHSTKKRIQHYFENETTKRFISALLKEEILNNRDPGEPGTDVIEIKRGKYGGTWLHPYLFVDFAMWLSPEFKVTVIRWVYDNLISLRIDAGDSFKEVNEALFNVTPNSPPYTYSNEAKMINKLVFGTPDRGQRNGATEKQLSLLKGLQKVDIELIKKGLDYYDRYEELKNAKKYLQLSTA